ncbi:hypothetical protein B0H34DRAFT_802663 [Crassisporium funariophilum]|nr:hypothetical protein B0H34DRAFT_802663 [Crassisporium funariophilum]
MRWSLIIPTFVLVQYAFSFSYAAPVIPPLPDQLERRAKADSAKASPKTYRGNAAKHPFRYQTEKKNIKASRHKLEVKDRLDHGKALLATPNTDADHIYEDQMVKKVLQDNGMVLRKLPHDFIHEVRRIINSPENMALIPAGINRGKGQLVKHGMKGKAITPKGPRDQYTKLSHPTAKKIALDLDNLAKKYKLGLKAEAFVGELHKTMKNAKIFEPGELSPVGSESSLVSGHSGAGLRSSARNHHAVKEAVQVRKSPRIAENMAKGKNK